MFSLHRSSGSLTFSHTISEMVSGNSYASGCCWFRFLNRRRDPQYQQISIPKARIAIEMVIQKSTEKWETVESVLVAASGKSFWDRVLFLNSVIWSLISFISLSAWAACCMISDGSRSGLKDQEN